MDSTISGYTSAILEIVDRAISGVITGHIYSYVLKHFYGCHDSTSNLILSFFIFVEMFIIVYNLKLIDVLTNQAKF